MSYYLVPKTVAAAEDQAAKDETTTDAKPDTTETGADGGESTHACTPCSSCIGRLDML